MSEIFGTFLLSQKDGSLKGEFFNNKMKQFSEEVIRVIESRSDDPFIGSFDVSWKESAGAITAVLETDKEEEDIYMLTWTEVKLNGELQNVNFTGRGVLRSGLLVAVYSMNHLQYQPQ